MSGTLANHHLAGWGNVPVVPCQVARPEYASDLRPTMHDDESLTWIARGLGRSYGDPAINSDAGVFDCSHLNRFLAFDPENGLLTAEGGVSLKLIIDTFLPRGWFLPVTPGTKFVTLGGAIAADVHGKNHHQDGSIANFVSHFRLLTGQGEILECSREENSEVFWATLGGMGLTGIILACSLTLVRVPSGWCSVDYLKVGNLDEALEQFAAGDDGYQFSVAWIDVLAKGAKMGRSVLMRGNWAAAEELSKKYQQTPHELPKKTSKTFPFNTPSMLLNGTTMRAFNSAFYFKNSNGKQIVDYDSFFYPLDGIQHWNRAYGKAGFVQYQVALPPDTARAGLVELLEKLTKASRGSLLAVLKTFGAANDGLLSFPTAGMTLALDIPNTGKDLFPFLHECDEIVLKHGGRLYLAKDTCTTAATFAQMYPNLPAFQEICQRLDPAGRWSSSQARRLNLRPSGAASL